MRSLYIALLQLHPRRFRERFAEEMLNIFDESGSRKLPLLGDALASLLRQRFLRDPEPSRAAATSLAQSGIPMFFVFEPSLPRRTALIHGALLSLAAFSLMTTAIGRASGRFPWPIIGAHDPRPRLLGVDRRSITPADLNTTVRIPELNQRGDRFLRLYFKIIPVLSAVDLDRDLTISDSEIILAPASLRILDLNQDGILSAEECGFFAGRDAPDTLEPHRSRFMRSNPVLAALDADGDGEISDVEMRNSTAGLRSLDQNRDGSLTPSELLPPPRRDN